MSLARSARDGEFAAGSPQMQGYLIAQENCFRCHNAGPYGGRKAAISWSLLAKIANEKPDYFSAYIKDPQLQKAHTRICPAFLTTTMQPSQL